MYNALPASQKDSSKVVDNISTSTGLPVWVIIVIIAGVAIVVAASAIAITVILMKKHYSVKRAKEQSGKDKSLEEIFGSTFNVENKPNDFDIFDEHRGDTNDNDQGQD